LQPLKEVVENGLLWGRGAIDTQDNMIVAIEAVEQLPHGLQCGQ